ncbi:craniofacial development protein 2-like [Narcine bancroftii]|uniref:craniofacial development protein 2-like n=1 Tax=Narcine bancroftii TaxID=1343680 RepID=UPI0038320C54
MGFTEETLGQAEKTELDAHLANRLGKAESSKRGSEKIMKETEVALNQTQAEPAEKNKFYTDLRNLIQRTPTADKVVILGDFNARVGKDSETWPGILGKHGVGKCNDNGHLLLELCAEQRLVITNTLFQQRDSLKTTWMHPRSKHWHLLDYILV